MKLQLFHFISKVKRLNVSHNKPSIKVFACPLFSLGPAWEQRDQNTVASPP